MTHTINRIFLDSSIFFEAYKEQHIPFFLDITQSDLLECCISEIVCSKYWYQVLGLVGQKSPLTVKEQGGIGRLISQNEDVFEFFTDYIIVTTDPAVIPVALDMMRQYNLLSNDALIMASCKANQITLLASHDTDFEEACKGEGIQLITPENYLERLSFLSNEK